MIWLILQLIIWGLPLSTPATLSLSIIFLLLFFFVQTAGDEFVDYSRRSDSHEYREEQ